MVGASRVGFPGCIAAVSSIYNRLKIASAARSAPSAGMRPVPSVRSLCRRTAHRPRRRAQRRRFQRAGQRRPASSGLPDAGELVVYPARKWQQNRRHPVMQQFHHAVVACRRDRAVERRETFRHGIERHQTRIRGQRQGLPRGSAASRRPPASPASPAAPRKRSRTRDAVLHRLRRRRSDTVRVLRRAGRAGRAPRHAAEPLPGGGS